MKCRSCAATSLTDFVDLGQMPNANSFRKPADADRPELFLPLKALVCENCKLVQLAEGEGAGFFFDDRYPYFSSWSDSWLAHGRRYAQAMIAELGLDGDALVVEVASNDGYLLQHFKAGGIPVLGIDPAGNCADAARANHGIETVVDFFGEPLARRLVDEGFRARLMMANNVLAHVPDPNDFVRGFKTLLRADGLVTFEFQHVLELIRQCQFDTIYHEHFMYLSLLSADAILRRNGLRVVRVDRLPTHGGSLRLHVRHVEWDGPIDPSVADTLAEERAAGLDEMSGYSAFPKRVAALKRRLLSLMIPLKDQGKRIAGYGAPAKGNTLLNYCGVGKDFLDFTVDRNTWKQGLLLPGTRIPILPPSAIEEGRPDFILVLPWNLETEIVSSMAHVARWGGRFIVPAPDPRVVS